MEKMNGESLNIENEKINIIKEKFPETITDGKIDFEKLKLILGENIEDSEERYNFTWNGKKDAIRLSQTPTTGTLRPDKENSKNWDETQNLYIEGDNLEVLKILQKSYHEKIKMIYIDPPYNTGKDFVYKDDYRNNIKNYLEFTDQVDEEGKKLSTNAETSGRYHTDWLNMMYPRLRLARNLLTDDGVIFISIDDNEQANLKKICDEIFGESNFIAQSVRKRRQSQANLSKNISPIHEYVFIYSKSEKSELNRVPGRVNEKDYRNPDNDPRGPYVTMPCTNKGGAKYSVVTPTGNKIKEEWRFKKETYNKLLKDNKIVFPREGKGKPRYKLFLEEKKKQGVLANTWWSDLGSNQEATKELKDIMESLTFNNSKPIELLKFCSLLGSDRDSIILDFFSGSSTTAHAVMDLNVEDGGNRKYIMVQLPEPTDEKSEAFKSGYKTIADIGRERIRRAGEKILEDNKDKDGIEDLDIGFKSFKLDSSNIKEWNPEYIDKESDLLDLVNNFVEGREEKDILYEIILKYGIDLTTPIEEHIINNKKIYNVGFGSVYIVLDNKIDNSVVEKIIDLNREYNMPNPIVVFKDNGFENDEIKLNAKLTLQDNGIEEVVSI